MMVGLIVSFFKIHIITKTYACINYLVSMVSSKIAGVEGPPLSLVASTLCTSYAGRCTIEPGVSVMVSLP